MDIVEPYTRSEKGNKYILTMICEFSKWIECVPIPHTKAPLIAEKFLEYVICRFGKPERIHSDRGSNFMSTIMKSLCTALGIKKTSTTAYHPQSNGGIERMHATLGNSLRLMVNENQTDWDMHIPMALLSYRTTLHTSLQENPAYVIYGRDLTLPTDLMIPRRIDGIYAMGLDPHGFGTEVAYRFSRVREKYLQNMEEQTQGGIENANKKRKYTPYKIGDLVLMKTPLAKNLHSKKLHRPYTGKYRIIEQKGPVNYVIKQVGGRKVKTIHADNMAKFHIEMQDQITHWALEAEEIFKQTKTAERENRDDDPADNEIEI